MISNAEIGELFAQIAEEIGDRHRSRAFRRAARASLSWPVEAADLVAQGLSPEELTAIGPRLAARIKRWVEEPPQVDFGETRRDFLTLTEVNSILAEAEPIPVRGDLQMHSTGSDGGDPVAVMANAALERGYEYIAITDHTAGLKIAGGMDADAFALQAAEIAAVNASLAAEGASLRVLQGCEMNLDTAGNGDMDPDFLAGLDIVVGSFHSKLSVDDDQTHRYMGALANPDVQILGHPRGRMYNRRKGVSADWERVLEAAEASGKALEIDAYPDRQDLNVEILKKVAPTDIYISIDTDAHAAEQLWFIDYGIAAALRAGIRRDRIINTWPRDQLLAWVADLRARRA